LTQSQRLREQTISARVQWELQLKELLAASKIALVGIGHPMRGDDYVGSFIVKRIIEATDGTLPENVYLFDAEDNVENLITRLSRIGLPQVVFIDACEMRAKPGEINLLSVAETSYPFFTTHGIPLKVLSEHLLKGSEVWVLAIQPKETEFDADLSPQLRDAASYVSNFIVSNLMEGVGEVV
jgi:hydrogenase 3 maturation protease